MGTRQTVGLFWLAYERTRVGHTALFLQLEIGRASGRLLVGCAARYFRTRDRWRHGHPFEPLRQGCLYGANKASGEFLFSAIAPATYKVAVVTQAGIFETARSLVVTEVSTLKTNLQLSTADAGLVLI